MSLVLYADRMGGKLAPFNTVHLESSPLCSCTVSVVLSWLSEAVSLSENRHWMLGESAHGSASNKLSDMPEIHPTV